MNDPWFWLREKDSPDVVKYLQAENAYAESMTQDLKPFSEVLYKEFLSHIKQTDMDVPTRIGRFYYYARTLEGEQYPIHCRKVASPDLSFDDKAHEEVPGGYDPLNYASERLWATARDGTKIPISIMHPKNFKKDGNAPLWLYGYGSYGIGEAAYFDSERVSLMDRGLAYAIAHVRGGNEMGEGWHDNGMLLKKKHTFLDFIDCAEFLEKRSGHLARPWSSRAAALVDF